MINESEREVEKVVHILNEAGLAEFVISIFGHTEYTMNFEVRQVASWTVEDDPKPEATELYLNGFIKFDGDGHINFGERGYLHLCGEGGFKNHCQVISAVHTLAESTIKNFNKEAAQ